MSSDSPQPRPGLRAAWDKDPAAAEAACRTAPSSNHHNAALTQISMAYMQSASCFVASRVFPTASEVGRAFAFLRATP